MRVNRMFADQLSPLMREDDVIWVHDYHLMLLGAGVARARPPQPDRLLPAHALSRRPTSCRPCRRTSAIFGSLAYYDLVGFQTDNDRDNFARYLRRCGANRRGDAYEIDGRQVRLGDLPGQHRDEGLHAPRPQRRALRRWWRCVRESLGDSRLVLGVDRLDYSKGIPDRIKAFERFLETNPEWRGKVTLLADHAEEPDPRSRNTARSKPR